MEREVETKTSKSLKRRLIRKDLRLWQLNGKNLVFEDKDQIRQNKQKHTVFEYRTADKIFVFFVLVHTIDETLHNEID